jgi:hypothetical protein
MAWKTFHLKKPGYPACVHGKGKRKWGKPLPTLSWNCTEDFSFKKTWVLHRKGKRMEKSLAHPLLTTGRSHRRLSV